MENFREHFIKFKSKLDNKENFAFSRYSDGEMYILQNKELVLDNNLIQYKIIVLVMQCVLKIGLKQTCLRSLTFRFSSNENSLRATGCEIT